MAFPPHKIQKGWPAKGNMRSKIPTAKPKSEFGDLEEIGAAKPPLPKRNPMFMADGSTPPPAPGPDVTGGDPGRPPMDDDMSPPPNLDPLTLHWVIGILQEAADAAAGTDEDDQAPPPDDVGDSAPPPDGMSGGGA